MDEFTLRYPYSLGSIASCCYTFFRVRWHRLRRSCTPSCGMTKDCAHTFISRKAYIKYNTYSIRRLLIPPISFYTVSSRYVYIHLSTPKIEVVSAVVIFMLIILWSMQNIKHNIDFSDFFSFLISYILHIHELYKFTIFFL